ncbi:MAG: GNAT family N-acetyltransferase [Chloroflexi bacterium]|nr:GNAT family N-acetyltransferase [Chloroflexota bacterium]
MQELNSNQFHLVTSLFNNIDHNIAVVYSVIEGNSPGRVFVDRIDTPTTAYVIFTGAFHYIGGDVNNDTFNRAMISYIFEQFLPGEEEQEIILFAFSDAWREKLDILLQAHGAITIERKVFNFNPTKFQAHANWREQVPDGFNIKQIDANLAQKHAEFKPVVDANTKRFGVCILKGDEIAAVCTAVCVGGGEAEIDIHTEEKYQRRGLATIAACAFIEETLSRNLTPNWACWPEREASYALALKLGFVEKTDAPVHLWADDL